MLQWASFFHILIFRNSFFYYIYSHIFIFSLPNFIFPCPLGIYPIARDWYLVASDCLFSVIVMPFGYVISKKNQRWSKKVPNVKSLKAYVKVAAGTHTLRGNHKLDPSIITRVTNSFFRDGSLFFSDFLYKSRAWELWISEVAHFLRLFLIAQFLISNIWRRNRLVILILYKEIDVPETKKLRSFLVGCG